MIHSDGTPLERYLQILHDDLKEMVNTVTEPGTVKSQMAKAWIELK